MNSRQRLQMILDHQEADRLPLDLGATPVSGMHVSSVYLLRQALGLDTPGTPVKVSNIYQMLGEIQSDLANALGVDTIGIPRPTNSFGILNQGWKEWRTFDGTPVLVPEGFNTQLETNGDLLLYPQGDTSAPACARMPKDGYYFDTIIRQPPIDEDNLNVEDNLEEFTLLTPADLDHYRAEVTQARLDTEKALVLNIGGSGFGDVAQVPGPQLKYPKGIRDIEEWYLSHISRPGYIYEVFERQCKIALQNLELIYQAVGDKIDVFYIGGTDFGGQRSLLYSPRTYHKLYKPFHKQINDWIHSHTTWKTFMHTDGAIMDLIPAFIESGVDILNPVQWTAEGMDPKTLKDRFGKQIVFWGAGVDTQGTLPFGTPDDVRREVAHIISIFKPGGGFVFTSVHNIQANVPINNLLAFFEGFRNNSVY